MFDKQKSGYECWLGFRNIRADIKSEFEKYFKNIVAADDAALVNTAVNELAEAVKKIGNAAPQITKQPVSNEFIIIGLAGKNRMIDENISGKEKTALMADGYLIKHAVSGNKKFIMIASVTDKGALYGTFSFLKEPSLAKKPQEIYRLENPSCPLRMINNWDDMDGTIERGYAGRSFFYDNNEFIEDMSRIKDYARILSSVGINGAVINNVNVRKHETHFITKKYLGNIKKIADIFRMYGIRIYLSINYASPIAVDNLPTADPLDPQVKDWWKSRAKEIYGEIPDFGGFLVKADSEFTPGPFTYKRNHAEGANMIAEALEDFGGIVIWRCFVYNCVQDWRDRNTDRARAAYDNFIRHDGQFKDNVVLQIKNGPLDFQVREPVHPLFGALTRTNYMMEFQIAQEYTGQQKHVCYLAEMWKEILEFDTYAKGMNSKVKDIVTGKIFKQKHCGFAAVVNTGTDANWTGHDLAQANLYAYGRLSWDPELGAKEIAEEWLAMTFGNDALINGTIFSILMDSWKVYEKYTAPLGIGWMVNPSHHYGPSVDGYEYSKWGTYHRADTKGIGVDRTVKSGTGYAGLYAAPNSEIYEDPAKCPDELILFFHHLPYNHVLKSGKTIIEHIYDIHFEGVSDVEEMKSKWGSLKGMIDDALFERVEKRFAEQLDNSKEWRDVINTYFYRKTGVEDKKGRKIFF